MPGPSPPVMYMLEYTPWDMDSVWSKLILILFAFQTSQESNVKFTGHLSIFVSNHPVGLQCTAYNGTKDKWSEIESISPNMPNTYHRVWNYLFRPL